MLDTFLGDGNILAIGEEVYDYNTSLSSASVVTGSDNNSAFFTKDEILTPKDNTVIVTCTPDCDTLPTAAPVTDATTEAPDGFGPVTTEGQGTNQSDVATTTDGSLGAASEAEEEGVSGGMIAGVVILILALAACAVFAYVKRDAIAERMATTSNKGTAEYSDSHTNPMFDELAASEPAAESSGDVQGLRAMFEQGNDADTDEGGGYLAVAASTANEGDGEAATGNVDNEPVDTAATDTYDNVDNEPVDTAATDTYDNVDSEPVDTAVTDTYDNVDSEPVDTAATTESDTAGVSNPAYSADAVESTEGTGDVSAMTESTEVEAEPTAVSSDAAGESDFGVAGDATEVTAATTASTAVEAAVDGAQETFGGFDEVDAADTGDASTEDAGLRF